MKERLAITVTPQQLKELKEIVANRPDGASLSQVVRESIAYYLANYQKFQPYQ